MKRTTYISTIKTQINAKFSPQGASDRDFIVFRPKSYIFNPILAKQSTKNMTSMFSLENKRKSQPSLVKVQFKFKEKQENNESPEKELQIQRCTTFNKKFRFNNTRYIDSEKSFSIRTPREKAIKTSMDKFVRLKNAASTRSEKKMKHQFLIGLEKKNLDTFFLNQINSNISFQGKQNCSKKFNFHPLKRVINDEQSIDLNRVSLFKERIKQKVKQQPISPNPQIKETHKRVFTDLPQFVFPRATQKTTTKSDQIMSCNTSQIQFKKDDDTIDIEQFKPWQTIENFDNHDYILDQDSQSM